MKIIKTNKKEVSTFGLVLDWRFHKKRRWVSAYSYYLVEAIIREFNPRIISSQLSYNFYKRRLKYIVSCEPGWAAPKIKYDKKISCTKAVMYSDPHYETEKRWQYFDENRFNYILSFFKSPFFEHFKGFPPEKFIYFPWAVPDQFISDDKIEARSTDVAIFGGKYSDAYDVRNWCRQQTGVTNYDFSGVENKKMSDREYYMWLRRFDAIVAAGSSYAKYNLVTPKYFEIASSGALLIGQYCEDLDFLGFTEANSLLFTKEDFIEKINLFKTHPEAFLEIRENGRALVQRKHKVSDRIKVIKRLFYGE